MTTKKQDNLVHIFRLNGKRNLYFQPDKLQFDVLKKGCKKEFGKKMNLGDVSSYQDYDKYEEISLTSSKGKEYTVRIKCWNNMLLRGSRKYIFIETSYELNSNHVG